MPVGDWRGEVRTSLLEIFDLGESELDDFERAIEPHIEAAYKRGLEAGRSQGRYTTGRKKWKKED